MHLPSFDSVRDDPSIPNGLARVVLECILVTLALLFQNLRVPLVSQNSPRQTLLRARQELNVQHIACSGAVKNATRYSIHAYATRQGTRKHNHSEKRF